MLDKRMNWAATPQAQAAIAALGRTEDVHWSPDGRHIAIAAFARNEVLVLTVEQHEGIRVSAPRWIACPRFESPHGVFWMDGDRLIVANRLGGVTAVAVPEASLAGERIDVAPLAFIASGCLQVRTPGSVCSVPLGGGVYELLVCNNYAHCVTSHLVDARKGLSILSGAVLLEAGLGVPDGVAVSPDRGWIAISNHEHHSVFVYRNTPELNPDAAPEAVLEGLAYPHGLRFTPDGSALLVADAGRPEVYCFRRSSAVWSSRRSADRVLRVLDDADFRAGQYNPQEGGPKGIALSPDGAVLAISCQQRALDFFDASVLQVGTTATCSAPDDAEFLRSLVLRQLPPAFEAAERLQMIQRSHTWRWTHWLYELEQSLRRWRRQRRQARRHAATVPRAQINANSGRTPS